PSMVRFVGEFGAQSVPESAGFMHPDHWPDLDWDHLAEHHGLRLDVIERHAPRRKHLTFESWREATQLHQAEVLRRNIESLRRLKYRPTGGFCFLSLYDPHPAVGWGVLDHLRIPKAAWQAVTEACSPVVVVADHLPNTFESGEPIALDVHVVSDLRSPLIDAHCTATLRWNGGEQCWRWRGDVPADSCVRVGTVQFVTPAVAVDLWLDLVVEHGDAVVTNRYTSRAKMPTPRI
ncbi:MAG: hypothetical protein RI900_900, partial [Actinomycetota bacterium]